MGKATRPHDHSQRPRTFPWTPLCRVAVVVLQQPTEPFAAPQGALTRSALADRRKEEHVALALMVPLVMKMLDILRQRMAERRFPKEDEPRRHCQVVETALSPGNRGHIAGSILADSAL